MPNGKFSITDESDQSSLCPATVPLLETNKCVNWCITNFGVKGNICRRGRAIELATNFVKKKNSKIINQRGVTKENKERERETHLIFYFEVQKKFCSFSFLPT